MKPGKADIRECKEMEKRKKEKGFNTVQLPNEIWGRVVHWLPPLDRQNFTHATKCASDILTSSQTMNLKIWAHIFYNKPAFQNAMRYGVDLALVGCINDIGKEQTPKPYLFLTTLPRRIEPESRMIQRRAGILDSFRGQSQFISGAREIDYPEFTLNIDWVYYYDEKYCDLPLARISQFSTGHPSILYYSRDRPLDVSVKRYITHRGFGRKFSIALEDEESISLSCISGTHPQLLRPELPQSGLEGEETLLVS